MTTVDQVQVAVDGTPPRIPLVTRHRLLARLRVGGGARVVVLAAPAGSGKSTLLEQWAAEEPRPVAWVPVSSVHRDPVLFVEDIADAIAASLPDGSVAAALPRLQTLDALRNQTRLSRAIAAEGRRALLVLDDVHLLRGQLASLDLVVALVDRLPAGWTVAIAQRGGADLPIARWGLGGSLVTLGYEDLILDATECRHVLASLGVKVTEGLVLDVLERTEGWPAGVYLAGLALRSDRPLRAGVLIAGDDALVRSYLDSEILAAIDPEDRELLVRTSILDEISGPLAEAITGDASAGERLLRIAGQNLLVSSVDPQQRWFRCHSLLRERLQRELTGGRHGAAEAHARASAWYEANDRISEAVAHAFASGDHVHAQRLVVDSLQREYRSGHVETIRAWLDRFTQDDLAHNRELALNAAWFAALEGDTDGAARWVAVAGVERADEEGLPVSPDGLDAWLIRAHMVPDGPERALADALRSQSLHDDSWRWRATGLTASGAAQLMLGDAAAALAAFEATERCAGIDRAVVRLVTRAERAVHAMGRHAWTEAEQILVVDRRSIFDDPDGGRMVGVIWLCADARMSLHRGDIRGAQDRLRRAQIGRPRLTWLIPWFSVRCLTLMAQTQLLVGDPEGARASIAQAREVIGVRPKLGHLIAAVDEVADRVRHAPGSRSETSALSPAELRLLPFLQTYLSFKEIGARLGITGNTVKTEAMSIYAKIGATSRSEAVEHAVASGLLEDPFA